MSAGCWIRWHHTQSRGIWKCTQIIIRDVFILEIKGDWVVWFFFFGRSETSQEKNDTVIADVLNAPLCKLNRKNKNKCQMPENKLGVLKLGMGPSHLSPILKSTFPRKKTWGHIGRSPNNPYVDTFGNGVMLDEHNSGMEPPHISVFGGLGQGGGICWERSQRMGV